jgi:hydroxymethylbilane synthase
MADHCRHPAARRCARLPCRGRQHHGPAPRARLGTSAPRRAAQALNLRPDLNIVPFRGNVATRLGKLAAGEADATLLAMAGLNRLDQAGVGTPLEAGLAARAGTRGDCHRMPQ